MDEDVIEKFRERLSRVFNRDGLWSCEFCYWIDCDPRICRACDAAAKVLNKEMNRNGNKPKVYGFNLERGKHLIDIEAATEDEAKIKLINMLEKLGYVECLGERIEKENARCPSNNGIA